jgi:class 3 adenylate cyclase
VLVEYEQKNRISHLKGKLLPQALENNESAVALLEHLKQGARHESFVISIDIRRSTDLMLYAKTPKDFAFFIKDLCARLAGLVLRQGGILDKFTGDGIIAYFPTFYSGDDSGYRALKTASEAINVFNKCYSENRRCFRAVLISSENPQPTDSSESTTGLGVGVDYGEIEFVELDGTLSAVGSPVVFACRLSGTPAGTICVNQSAKDNLSEKYEPIIEIRNIQFKIKNLGMIEAYEVALIEDLKEVCGFPWEKSEKNEEKEPDM